MTSTTTIHTIANHLNQREQQFDCQPITGEVDVLQVTVQGREEIPIFISITEEQILCISYLWGEDEVKPESRSEMLEAMLEMNIPMPLSAFAMIGDKYVVYGALATTSSLEDIEHEVNVLSDNGLEVIEEMADYLI